MWIDTVNGVVCRWVVMSLLVVVANSVLSTGQSLTLIGRQLRHSLSIASCKPSVLSPLLISKVRSFMSHMGPCISNDLCIIHQTLVISTSLQSSVMNQLQLCVQLLCTLWYRIPPMIFVDDFAKYWTIFNVFHFSTRNYQQNSWQIMHIISTDWTLLYVIISVF